MRMLLCLALLAGCSAVPPSRPAAVVAAKAFPPILANYLERLAADDKSFRDDLAAARQQFQAVPGTGEVFDALEAYWTAAQVESRKAQLTLAPAPAMFAVRDWRLVAHTSLTNRIGSLPNDGDPGVAKQRAKALFRRETKVWEDTMVPALKDDFVKTQAVRADLFRRKYFEDPEEQGNFIEGWLNSNIGLFASTDGGSLQDPGVSPWEAVARLEPAISTDGKETPLVLGSLGCVHHFFPGYAPSGLEARPQETFWSNWLQRVGLRFSAGAALPDGAGADFVVGAGVQLRSVTVWAMWDLENDDFFVAVGASDFAFLGDLLPVFGR